MTSKIPMAGWSPQADDKWTDFISQLVYQYITQEGRGSSRIVYSKKFRSQRQCASLHNFSQSLISKYKRAFPERPDKAAMAKMSEAFELKSDHLYNKWETLAKQRNEEIQTHVNDLGLKGIDTITSDRKIQLLRSVFELLANDSHKS